MDPVWKFVVLLAVCGSVTGDSAIPVGHLQPLGGHRPPDVPIDELHTIPHPREFWDKYVKHEKAVILRGAAKNSPSFTLWTDEYLKDKYGKLEVRLEGKREKHSWLPIGVKGIGRDTIEHFLDTYRDKDAYIVSQLPTDMYHEVLVQPCLTCGSFRNSLVEIDLWMSSNGGSSILHKDAFNAINCLYNGTKHWKMIERKYEPLIHKELPEYDDEFLLGKAERGFAALDVNSKGSLDSDDIKALDWDTLRAFILEYENQEPSNTELFEYSYTMPHEIMKVMLKLAKKNGQLTRSDFIHAYMTQLGGTEKFGTEIFDRLVEGQDRDMIKAQDLTVEILQYAVENWLIRIKPVMTPEMDEEYQEKMKEFERWIGLINVAIDAQTHTEL
uniref:Cupin-like domain-containing protein n=1 Tax=Branchiostoma floridae TaxID=7739 RepID=C3ZDF1_BRAFL|eukprot:XP_002593495.1 hypothetical protein BRAFLDRAFT_70717 [Branchiostoma floridae]